MILRLTQTRVFLVRSMAGLSRMFATLRRWGQKAKCSKAVPSITVSPKTTQPSDSPIPSPPARLPAPHDNKAFCLLPPPDASAAEIRLYKKINRQVRVELGYGKAFGALHREFNGQSSYEPTIRPYDLNQPSDLPPITELILSSEAHLFADAIGTLIHLIGLQRSYRVLKAAKIEEVPGIRYAIRRVSTPPSVGPETSTTSDLPEYTPHPVEGEACVGMAG